MLLERLFIYGTILLCSTLPHSLASLDRRILRSVYDLPEFEDLSCEAIDREKSRMTRHFKFCCRLPVHHYFDVESRLTRMSCLTCKLMIRPASILKSLTNATAQGFGEVRAVKQFRDLHYEIDEGLLNQANQEHCSDSKNIYCCTGLGGLHEGMSMVGYNCVPIAIFNSNHHEATHEQSEPGTNQDGSQGRQRGDATSRHTIRKPRSKNRVMTDSAQPLNVPPGNPLPNFLPNINDMTKGRE